MLSLYCQKGDRTMEEMNTILKEAIYNHVSEQHRPITASEVACAMHITTQKASALLNSLCYSNRIKWVPYHSKKGYGLEEVVTKRTYDYVCNNSNSLIKTDWEVITDSDIEFKTEKITGYKNKIFKLIYEKLLDYFDLTDTMIKEIIE